MANIFGGTVSTSRPSILHSWNYKKKEWGYMGNDEEMEKLSDDKIKEFLPQIEIVLQHYDFFRKKLGYGKAKAYGEIWYYLRYFDDSPGEVLKRFNVPIHLLNNRR